MLRLTSEHARITGVSNSATQRIYIEAECARRGLSNLQIITCDMNRFDTPGRLIECCRSRCSSV